MTSRIAHLVRRFLGLRQFGHDALKARLNVGNSLKAEPQAGTDPRLGGTFVASVRDYSRQGQHDGAVVDHAQFGEHVNGQDRDGHRFGDLDAVRTKHQELLSTQRVNFGHSALLSDFKQGTNLSLSCLGVETTPPGTA